MDETVHRCAELIEAGSPVQHVAVNVAKIVAIRDDDRLREIVERCDLVSVDGQPVVWASRLLRDPLPERVTGIDLMFRLLALAEERLSRLRPRRQARGARDRCGAAQRALSGLTLAGFHHGYFSDEESGQICEAVRQARPHILLVAMTSPRKEYWLAEHASDLGVPFSMGVGDRSTSWRA